MFCAVKTLLIMHPKLTEQVMKLFACVKVYNRSFCWEACQSIILIICVGIPLLLLYNVFSMKKRYSKNLDHILWSEYAYITKSYRTEVVMWESILMIRNVGIAFLSVILLTQSLAIQILWGSLWILFFFMIQTSNKIMPTMAYSTHSFLYFF
jgi:hypothetical protein